MNRSRLVLLILLSALAAHAEIKHVEMRVEGMT